MSAAAPTPAPVPRPLPACPPGWRTTTCHACGVEGYDPMYEPRGWGWGIEGRPRCASCIGPERQALHKKARERWQPVRQEPRAQSVA